MREGTKTGIIVAVIGVLGAVGGAVVGGVLSKDAALEAGDKEVRRQERALEKRQQGLARVWIADFDEAVDLLCYMREHLIFSNYDRVMQPKITQDDRRFLAARLNADAWQIVASAHGRLQAFDGLNKTYQGDPLDPVNEGINGMIDKVQAAQDELESLAGYPSDSSRIAGKACSPKPLPSRRVTRRTPTDVWEPLVAID
jgi:hypothetical protein